MRILTQNPIEHFWTTVVVLCLICTLSSSSLGIAQGTIARAREATISSSRPTSFQIRQNVLQQQQAALEEQIRVATRCIQDSSKPQTLRDPQGNINLIPQIDLTNCSRQLRTLQRQLASLAKQFEMLASDANATAMQFQSRQQEAQRASRTRWLTGQ